MTDKLKAAMDAYMDRQLMRAVYGDSAGATTTSATATAAEPLTIEKLLAVIDSLPKRETWVVWSTPTLPGSALVCDSPDEKLTIFHAGDWRTVERAWLEALAPERRHNPLYGLNPLWLDPDSLDSDERAQWKAAERARIAQLMAGTLSAAVQLSQVIRAWWRRLPGVT